MNQAIVYEVNLSICNSIIDQYLPWLQTHVQEMLQFKGFKRAHVYQELQEVNINSQTNVIVQYQIETLEELTDYFDHQSHKMRQHAVDKFGDRFSATRRILRKIE